MLNQTAQTEKNTLLFLIPSYMTLSVKQKYLKI